MLIRILTFAVALVLLTSLAVRYSRRRISLRKTLFWSAPWLLVAIVVLSPSLADEVAVRLGLQDSNGIDLVVYLGVGVAFLLLHRILLRLERLEQSLTRVVRHQALREAEDSRPAPAAAPEQGGARPATAGPPDAVS